MFMPETTKFLKYILLLNLISFSISILSFQEDYQCPREKPILKSTECQSTYCTPEEFSQNICSISNYYIETQWLNKFHIFTEQPMSHISVSSSPKGDLFLSSHKSSDDFDKYIYGFNSEGEGLFYNSETDSYTSFETIDFAIREYADYNNYVEIYGKGYLISVPTDDDIYLIDYVNKTCQYFTIRPYSKSSDTILKINGYNDMFFTAYIYCTDSYNKVCFLHFQSFKLNLSKLERVNNITNITTLLGTRTNCFQNKKGIIFCTYTKNYGTYDSPSLKHLLSVIDPIKFTFSHTITIEHEFLTYPMFDEMIELREDLYVLAYAIDEEVIKMQFKNITVLEYDSGPMLSFTNFFKNIKEIYLNEDKSFKYKSGSYKTNDLYKINDNKFALLIRDFSKDTSTSVNSIIQIYIFTIYNNDQNLNYRRYSFDLELYNKHSYGDIRGYTLGNFFGIILGLTLNRQTYNSLSTFMTFGYVNTTEQEMYDVKLKYNNTDSKIIISQYINDIENNLFGYEFIGVKILNLPSEEDAGYFINNITNDKVSKDDIVNRNSELRFILSDKYKTDIYSILFVGVVSEPSYERMNEFALEVKQYPLDENITDEKFYEPQILLGKKMNFKFRLSDCFDSCSTCIELSEDKNNQKCIKCRTGFYFMEGTNNCYDKIDTKYYFDEDKHMFCPCYDDCLTCTTKEVNSKQMNCLSCDYNLKYYNRSKNCLNCSKYVNYEQNECVNIIPDGYYLEDEELGTLGKCYYLCKTCSSGPYTKNNYFHMNCKTCIYTNSKYKPILEGDCPDSSDEEGEDTPVDGKCSYNKPILKDGKCQLIYCTPQEYNDNTCIIYNPTIKTQWLNNFHIFSEESSSSVCLASDIISEEKLIFLAQSQEMGYTEKYLYGFDKNGEGIFFDENKGKYNTFKKISFPVSDILFEKANYIEMDSEGFLLSTPVANILYIINYNTGERTPKRIDYTSYYSDKIILRQKKTSSKNAEFLTDFIYCNNNNLDDCYIMMKSFEENIQDINEITNLVSSVKVHYNSNLNCYKDDNNYIKCTYNKINTDSTITHTLGIFSAFTNKNMELEKEYELENNYDSNPSFDSMIEWSNNIYFIAYSLPENKNTIKILLKKVFNDIYTFRMSDYIESIPYILINEDSLYNIGNGEAKKNCLYKISDEKFAMMVNTFKDSQNNGIVIFIFTVYSYFSKINIRHYPISFILYNTLIEGKLLGYNLNGFFGGLIELNAPGDNSIKRAAFFTFGYMNTTKEITPMEGYDILFVKKEKIIFKDYFSELENNLFGYNLDNFKIISVPDENDCGYFTLTNQYIGRIYKDDLVSVDSKVTFYSSSKPILGNYTFVFAPNIKEPNYYSTMNTFCQKLESYPLDQNDTEIKFYSPKTFLGKEFTFNFFMEGSEPEVCYDNCKTCYKSSSDENDQQCIDCIDDFYKISETNNCFNKNKEGYYLDDETKTLMPCYQDCLTCSGKGESKQMNCISCKENFKFYQKSKNCLNCEKYVDFTQTGCINEIPEGYYVDDEYLGTLGKCHELCKTCEKGSDEVDGEIHMNCKVCKYSNVDYKTEIEGNCPDSQKDNDEDDDDKDDDKDNDKDDKKGKNVFLWILYSSIIIIVIVIIGIIILKYCRIKNSGDYQKLEKKGQNISMEDTTGLGVE